MNKNTERRLLVLDSDVMVDGDVKIHYGVPVAGAVYREIYGTKPSKDQIIRMSRAIRKVSNEELPQKAIRLLSLVFGEKTYTEQELLSLERLQPEADEMSLRGRLECTLYMIQQTYDAYT